MDQITNWMQSNWYELGSLAAQFTFLFAGLWFAGKILGAMRATQQQMGALLRLSMTNGLEERPKINETADEPMPSVLATPTLTPAVERPTSYSVFEKPERAEAPSLSSELSGRGKTIMPIPTAPIAEPSTTPAEDPIPYVAAPLTLPQGEHNEGHLAAAVQWLQTPMANKRKSRSALKKVVRWLQEPAR
jgi:hypothetical protein